MMRITRPTRNKTERTGWHKAEIEAACRVRGLSIPKLARKHKYTPAAFYLTLTSRHWPKVEGIISIYLGVPLHELWPDRYLADGSPRPEMKSRLRGAA